MHVRRPPGGTRLTGPPPRRGRPRAIRVTSTPARPAGRPSMDVPRNRCGPRVSPHRQRLNQLQATNSVRKRRVGAAYDFTADDDDAAAEVAGRRTKSGCITVHRYIRIIFRERSVTFKGEYYLKNWSLCTPLTGTRLSALSLKNTTPSPLNKDLRINHLYHCLSRFVIIFFFFFWKSWRYFGGLSKPPPPPKNVIHSVFKKNK